MSDPAAVGRLFDAAEKAIGPVTLRVNNAGVFEPRPVDREDVAHYDTVFRANVLPVLLTTAAFARRFRGDSGRVVNISSGGARAGMPGAAVYGASKAAVEGLTRGHAADLGPKGVAVNAVVPGGTETEMMKAGLPEDVKRHVVANTALGRARQPDDLAGVVAFPCSDDGRWVTGQFLDANGGMRY